MELSTFSDDGDEMSMSKIVTRPSTNNNINTIWFDLFAIAIESQISISSSAYFHFNTETILVLSDCAWSKYLWCFVSLYVYPLIMLCESFYKCVSRQVCSIYHVSIALVKWNKLM